MSKRCIDSLPNDPHPAAPGRKRCHTHDRLKNKPEFFVLDQRPGVVHPLVRQPKGNGFFSTLTWDIETTHLTANMGRIIAVSFHDVETDDVWTFRGDDPFFLNPDDPIDDSALVAAVRDQLEAYDVWLGWNSLLFDMKYLKARLWHADLRMPEPRWHVDGMWLVRSNLKAWSGLNPVAKFGKLPEQKTPISWEDWQRAMCGQTESMDQVVLHCEADVRTTTAAMLRLRQYIKKLERRA